MKPPAANNTPKATSPVTKIARRREAVRFFLERFFFRGFLALSES
jgi:hypothetical protein